MSGAVILHLVVYAGVAAFVLAVGWKFIRMQNMPLHLRWELYPVAHEGKRAGYGGSILEESDWWEKEREKSMLGELKVMIPEMTFLVALFENNRKLWWRSYPFHLGLYLLAGFMALLILGSVLELLGIGLTSFPGNVVYWLTKISAAAGLGLGALGALGLLILRLFDPKLRNYTSMGALFNLVFFLAVFGLAWITFIFVDPSFSMTRAFVQSLLLFNLTEPAGHPLLAAEVAAAVALIAYIPMTHMAHFFLKWFTYHQVRWEDEPNIVGSALEKKVIEQVGYPVTWSAAHINADGKKTWADIAMEDIKDE